MQDGELVQVSVAGRDEALVDDGILGRAVPIHLLEDECEDRGVHRPKHKRLCTLHIEAEESRGFKSSRAIGDESGAHGTSTTPALSSPPHFLRKLSDIASSCAAAAPPATVKRTLWNQLHRQPSAESARGGRFC